MRWFLLGCVATALLVGIFVYAPFLASVRGEQPFAPSTPTALAAQTTPTVPFAQEIESWLYMLERGWREYTEVQATLHDDAVSQSSFTAGAAFWTAACREHEWAERDGTHGGIMPVTRRDIGYACSHFIPGYEAIERYIYERSEADFTNGTRQLRLGRNSLNDALESFYARR